MKKGKLTLLLPSAGGQAGIYLCKHYKKNGDYRIIAADRREYHPLKKWADNCYSVSSAGSSLYLKEIKEIVKKERADIIIPITSYDMDFFCREDVRNSLDGVKMLVVDEKIQRILSHKSRCYQYLSAAGIAVPEIYPSLDDIRYPCIIKPEKGSGSRDVFVIENEQEYLFRKGKRKDAVCIQYLEGREYTADCLFDKEGQCLGANVRERMKTKEGAAVVTRNDYSINIQDTVYKLERLKEIKGPVNFQFKILPDGGLCVFDFNTRFASGGLPLTVESGFDIPNLLIRLICKEKAERWVPGKQADGWTMVRYYEEEFLKYE